MHTSYFNAYLHLSKNNNMADVHENIAILNYLQQIPRRIRYRTSIQNMTFPVVGYIRIGDVHAMVLAG